MKKPLNKNHEPVGICLLDSHSVVIALSEYNTHTMTRKITYAHQVRIVHTESEDSDILIQKIYDTFKFTLQKFSLDTQIVPSSIYVYLGDMLSHSVYRNHTMSRKTPILVTEKLLSEMKTKDSLSIKQKYEKLYKSPHTITHTAVSGRIVNGYPFTESQDKLPEKVFSLQHTLIHTVVPDKILQKVNSIVTDVYHTPIVTVFQNLPSVVIDHLSVKIPGSWLYVHIGEYVTSVCYIKNHTVKNNIQIPIGTGHILEKIMQDKKISLVDAQYMLKMVFDDRIDSQILRDIHKTIDDFWSTWRETLTKQLSQVVVRGATIPKIIYSYDSEIIRVDQSVFPREPYELWYGSRSVTLVPCESVLSDEKSQLLSRIYLRNLLLHIERSIEKVIHN